MKRFVCIIAIILLFFAIIIACQKENNPVKTSAEKGVSSEPPNNQQAAPPIANSLNDAILERNYSSPRGEDMRNKGADWVKMCLEYIYADYGISNIVPQYLSSASYSNLADEFEINPMLYSVKLSSQKSISGAQINPDGTYKFNVFIVTVAEKGKIVLSGILGPGEFDEYDALPMIYNVVAKEPRYKTALKPLPNSNLPKEFKQINMRLIYKSHNLFVLPGGIIAVIEEERVGEKGQFDVSVSLYDIEIKKLYRQLNIGECYITGIRVSQDKLVLETQKDNNSPFTEIFYIDAKGNMTSEKHPGDFKKILYSPDGSKYAYSNNGSLYTADIKNNTPNLLIKGNNSEEDNRRYYYPFAWVNNSLLIYGIGGYEWSNGCGIIDVNTGKDTFFKQAENLAMPFAYINGKLYTIIGEMGASFDPGIINLDDLNYPYRKLFKERGLIENTNIGSYKLSPDGTKIALLKTADTPNENNTLYICSTDDGSILKRYDFLTGFNSAQYLDFFENGRIAIYSERYAYCAKYMYLVNLE